MNVATSNSSAIDSGFHRAMMWLAAFAVFIVVECVVPSSTIAMISGLLLIFLFASLDLVRWRARKHATLHWLALASAVVAYATATALVVAIFDFNSNGSVATSFSELVRELGRAVSMYVGHCIAFAVFTVVGFVAAVLYRFNSGSGMPLLLCVAPCMLLTACLGVYHLFFGI
ncbi:MAG: hypothetical protein MUC43_08875 [Pirellula sp.]|jgi:hypothetical protein|nr:hypothetical protein [Pirellula sp.]